MFSRASPGANIPPAATVCILVLGATRASDLDSLISPRVVGPRSHFTLPCASHIGGGDFRMPCRCPPATHYGGFPNGRLMGADRRSGFRPRQRPDEISHRTAADYGHVPRDPVGAER